jgi:hypothetical protein
LALAGGLTGGLTGCGTIPETFMVTATEYQAADHLMLVRADPQTLGYRRLNYQAVVYPELGSFLRFRGHPDFLAEANNDGRHYMILYYLKTSQAFASRTLRETPRGITFAGPYPITRREVSLMKNMAALSQPADSTD